MTSACIFDNYTLILNAIYGMSKLMNTINNWINAMNGSIYLFTNINPYMHICMHAGLWSTRQFCMSPTTSRLCCGCLGTDKIPTMSQLYWRRRLRPLYWTYARYVICVTYYFVFYLYVIYNILFFKYIYVTYCYIFFKKIFRVLIVSLL